MRKTILISLALLSGCASSGSVMYCAGSIGPEMQMVAMICADSEKELQKKIYQATH